MTTVSIGPPMGPDEEAAHKRAIAEVLADEADVAVKNTRQTIKDLQASLKDRQAEAKRFRAEAKEN